MNTAANPGANRAAVRVGVSTRFQYDGEVVEVVELLATTAGNEVVLKNATGQRIIRVSVRELLASDRARIIPTGPGPSADDPLDLASVLLAELTDAERQQLRERAAHVQEVLTGYCSGTAEFAAEGEPRPEFDPSLPLTTRYRSKAAELNVTMRAVQQWVSDFHNNGEAGLIPKKDLARNHSAGRVDQRWIETALEVMAEHTGESKPSRTMVIDRTNARGPGAIRVRSGETAESSDSVSDAGAVGTEASDVPVEHQAESGYSPPSG